MLKLLLVDDNEDNRDMLMRRLTKKGYEVVMAVNGIDACEKALAEMPALILMDIEMPVMDGYAATRKLKADPATQRIPLIGLSAHAMSEHRDQALAAGCDDYATKPVEFSVLLAKIELLLNRAQPAG